MLKVQDILNVKFQPGRRFKENYQADHVDDYLDEVVTVMENARSAVEFDRLRAPKFGVTSSTKESYSQRDVDDFCGKIVSTFDELAKSLPETATVSVPQPAIVRETAPPVASSAAVSLTGSQIEEKSREIAAMFGSYMFDSPELLAKRVEDILKD